MLSHQVLFAASVVFTAISMSMVGAEQGLSLPISTDSCGPLGKTVQEGWELTNNHMLVCVPSNCCAEAGGYKDVLQNCRPNSSTPNTVPADVTAAIASAESYRSSMCLKYPPAPNVQSPNGGNAPGVSNTVLPNGGVNGISGSTPTSGTMSNSMQTASPTNFLSNVPTSLAKNNATSTNSADPKATNTPPVANTNGATRDSTFAVVVFAFLCVVGSLTIFV